MGFVIGRAKEGEEGKGGNCKQQGGVSRWQASRGADNFKVKTSNLEKHSKDLRGSSNVADRSLVDQRRAAWQEVVSAT